MDDWFSSDLFNIFKLLLDNIDEISYWYHGVVKRHLDICSGWRIVWLLHVQVLRKLK